MFLFVVIAVAAAVTDGANQCHKDERGKFDCSSKGLTTIPKLPQGVVRVRLNNNKITTIAKGAFTGLTPLYELDLRNNKITAIAKGAFTGLKSLKILRLNNNNITTIAKGAFTGLTSLYELNLRSNPLVCSANCELAAALSDLVGRNVRIFGTCKHSRRNMEILWFVKRTKCKKSCEAGVKKSGAYTIEPDDKVGMETYCDVATNGEVWTVIQRRQNSGTDFDRGWEDYKRGFGSPSGNFWLGNENIHRLTNIGYTVLRIELTDYEGNTAWAEYGKFEVAGEEDNFALSVGSYSGNAGDSLSNNNGMEFSTKDRDNDPYYSNCASDLKGAWWHNDCSYSNLNGRYQDQNRDFPMGIKWFHWKKDWSPIKEVEMKVRKPHP